MDFIINNINKVLNKNWNFRTQYRYSRDEIIKSVKSDDRYVATLWVVPITSRTNQSCYLLVIINRGTRTMLYTTTMGDRMPSELFRELSEVKDSNNYFAVVALRLKCEKNHEAFVIYLADMFSNSTYDPSNTLLSENDILKRYNTFYKQQQQQQQQQDYSNSDSSDDISEGKTPQVHIPRRRNGQGYTQQNLHKIKNILNR